MMLCGFAENVIAKRMSILRPAESGTVGLSTPMNLSVKFFKSMQAVSLKKL